VPEVVHQPPQKHFPPNPSAPLRQPHQTLTSDPNGWKTEEHSIGYLQSSGHVKSVCISTDRVARLVAETVEFAAVYRCAVLPSKLIHDDADMFLQRSTPK